MTAQQIHLFRELRGTKCVCGAVKQSGMSHCRACYRSLELPTRRALYRRIGQGYEEAYAASVNALRMKGNHGGIIMNHYFGVLENPVTPDQWTVISLTQPWASALFDGSKTIETRSWNTNYRGKLYIHASKTMPRYAKDFAEQEGYGELPLGVILGHVHLVDVRRTQDIRPSVSWREQEFGDYADGRFAWITCSPVLLPEPIPAKGQLQLWRFTPGGDTHATT